MPGGVFRERPPTKPFQKAKLRKLTTATLMLKCWHTYSTKKKPRLYKTLHYVRRAFAELLQEEHLQEVTSRRKLNPKEQMGLVR
eukprot:2757080-Amphidinium_carterae.1